MDWDDLNQAIVLWKLEHPEYRGPKRFIKVNVFREWFGYNGGRNWQRHEKQVKQVPEQEVRKRFEMSDLVQKLNESGLTERERTAVILHLVYGFAGVELGLLFDTTEQNSNQILQRGLRKVENR